jgi:hypothetical protein
MRDDEFEWDDRKAHAMRAIMASHSKRREPLSMTRTLHMRMTQIPTRSGSSVSADSEWM